MSFTNDKIAFTDREELREAVRIFTGADDSAKQQLISKYGEIRNWDVKNVTDMSEMFCDCHNFNSDISLWDVSNVTDMNDMFHNCPKFINSINGYRWNKQYWKFLKEIIKTRAIANYWLEQSSISSYAPAGAGRQRDLQSFKEFAIHSL